MKTLNLKQDLRHLYVPASKVVSIVEVPDLQYLMIDGRIEKGQEPSSSPGFQEVTGAMYAAAYTLKFMFKKRPKNPVDFPVMALEGLWWVEDGVFDITKKDNWSYTLMILEPEIVTPEDFQAAKAAIRRKRGESEALNRLRLRHFKEGLCMQVMHIGPYADEPATVERMRAFALEKGYRDLVGLGGKHHEIYMGDPRKADPAKLKTVLRHPIKGVR
jgi:hypothetical protein